MKKIILILVLILAACAPAASPIMLATATLGNVYYVSTTGNDANAGTIDAPFKTIAKVNSLALKAGDTVLFKRGGTWKLTGSEALNASKSGAEGQPITFGAYGSGNRPILNGTGQTNSSPGSYGLVVIGHNVTTQYVIVESLDLYNGINQGLGISNQSLGNSSDIIIQDCIIRNNRTSGYTIVYANNHSSSHDLIFRNNTVSGSKWNGMRITGGWENVEIYGNTFYNVYHNGIDMWPNDAKNNTNVRIYDNDIYAFGAGSGAGVYMPACSNCDIFNNRIHNPTASNNDTYGVKVGKGYGLTNINSNVTVRNNTIWNINTNNTNTHWGWGDTCANCSFTNNTVCASASAYFSGVANSGNQIFSSTSNCLQSTDTPTATESPTKTQTPIPPTLTSTPTPSHTATHTPTFTPTYTSTPTLTQTPTKTPTATPTAWCELVTVLNKTLWICDREP